MGLLTPTAIQSATVQTPRAHENSQRVKHLSRLSDVFAGLSFLSWSVLGLAHTAPESRFSAVRISIALVNLLVGVLFLLRSRPRHLGRAGDLAAALPSFLAGGLALSLSAAPVNWSVLANMLFCVGAAITMWSLASLGRLFAIFPAASTTIVRGPYKFLRHPAYFGELMMIIACLAAQPSWPLAGVVVLGMAAMVWRIATEERLLRRYAPSYGEYARRVRWRLLPGVW